MEQNAFADDRGSAPDGRDHVGVPWVWFGIGVGTALVLGAAVVFVLFEAFLSAPGARTAGDAGAAAPNRTTDTAPTPVGGATVAASEKAVEGSASDAPFSGKWSVNYACREPGTPAAPAGVGFGMMILDQTSPTAATVTLQTTEQQSPSKGQARIAGDQLSFQWTVTGQSRSSSLSGRLVDPETFTGAMTQVGSRADQNCNFVAEKMTGNKMTKPPVIAEPPP